MNAGMFIRRQLRDLQTYVPGLVDAKFAAVNLLSAGFGHNIDPEFRLLRWLGATGLALDVGGNRGQSIIALKRYADPRQIISFEPNPHLFRRLQCRYAKESRVKISPFGLGDKPGSFDLHVPSYRGFEFDGEAGLNQEDALARFTSREFARFDSRNIGMSSVRVSVLTLDELELAPDIVKIDVEGHELQVVEGGLATISRCKPVMIVEYPPQRLIDLLGESELKCYCFNGATLSDYRHQSKNAVFLTPQKAELAASCLQQRGSET